MQRQSSQCSTLGASLVTINLVSGTGGHDDVDGGHDDVDGPSKAHRRLCDDGVEMDLNCVSPYFL